MKAGEPCLTKEGQELTPSEFLSRGPGENRNLREGGLRQIVQHANRVGQISFEASEVGLSRAGVRRIQCGLNRSSSWRVRRSRLVERARSLLYCGASELALNSKQASPRSTIEYLILSIELPPP